MEDDQHNYGSYLHLSKLSVWGEKGSSTRARSLTLPRLARHRMAKGASARRSREWSSEIRLLDLRGHDFLLLFYFLVTCVGVLTQQSGTN